MSKSANSVIELNKIEFDSTNNRINFSTAVYSNGSPIADATAGSYANSAFTQANAAFASANNVAPQVQPAFDKANSAGLYANGAFTQANIAFSNTNLNVSGTLKLLTQGGDEGGEIFLGKATTNTSLTNGVTIDVFQNKLRIFENGGNNRGAFIDIANTTANVVGSEISKYDANTTSTGYFALPAGTLAQRPSNVANGAMRMNIQTGILEIAYNGAWANTISVGLGASYATAASSAAAIKNGTGTTIDGFYWINIPTVGPTQVYCDMNTNGGGWMLAAKIYNDSTKWNGYDSADWTSIGVFNETQSPTYAGHIKTHVYNYFPATVGQRLCYNLLSNNLYEGWSGTLYSILNGATQNSVNNRAAWIAWGQAAGVNYSFASQPNCNQAGTNKNYAYGARIGMSMNNEGDCSSNDSFIGFGTKGSGGQSYGIGSSDWNSGSYLNSGYQIGWIWVK